MFRRFRRRGKHQNHGVKLTQVIRQTQTSRVGARWEERREWHETFDNFHAILQTYGAKAHETKVPRIANRMGCKCESDGHTESNWKAKTHSAKVVCMANRIDAERRKCCRERDETRSKSTLCVNSQEIPRYGRNCRKHSENLAETPRAGRTDARTHGHRTPHARTPDAGRRLRIFRFPLTPESPRPRLVDFPLTGDAPPYGAIFAHSTP